MKYPEDFINKIICGDCLEVMKEMPKKSVDLIIADPPYNIGKDIWDKISNYLEWMGTVFKICERVLRDNGSFYWFHNQLPTIAKLMGIVEEKTGFVFKQFIVWNKRFNEASNLGYLNGHVESSGLRNYQRMTEYILFYALQDKTGLTQIMTAKLFKPIKNYFLSEYKKSKLTLRQANEIMELAITGANLAGELFGTKRLRFMFPTKEKYQLLQKTGFFQKKYKELRKEYENLRKEYENLRYTFNNQKTHHSVWNYEVEPKQDHVTPKPIDLIKNILLHSSNENDIIFDPFMGSGTTARAAKDLKRNFIGIEINPSYCKIAEERLTQGVL